VGIGVFSTTAQDFVPLAADLAPPARRGQIVGTVMSGLLLGILVSRTWSGMVADHFGWRAVFFTAAAVVAAFGVVAYRVVPSRPPASRASYAELLVSAAKLVAKYPVLGLATLTQGLLGLVFSAFWTVLAFHLEHRFFLSTSQIGYFGLAGAAGALAAPTAGKLADRRGPFSTIPIAIAITFLAFVGMALLPHALFAVILGAAAFDLGVQLSTISHQAIIYGLAPEARSSITGVYVGGMFVFFAIGSLLGNTLFQRFGWQGLTTLCLASCVAAYGAHRWTAHRAASRPRNGRGPGGLLEESSVL
jgi:predicted MFS family arabinose efflux permease